MAATPGPDPPPLGVEPDDPPAVRSTSAPAQASPTPVRVAPAVAATPPAVRRPAPVVRTQPKKRPAAANAAPPKKPAVVVVQRRAPHDRAPVPLATFVVQAEPLDDGLLVAAGLVLLVVALGGCVVLSSARRLLQGEPA